ncbi:MAG: glycosyl hydrolase 115 family protein [Phycisphaerae bacterium]|jgi:hypothetical protein
MTRFSSIVLLLISAVSIAAPELVSGAAGASDFTLVSGRSCASVLYDPSDAAVCGIAANCFADDVELVTGKKPQVVKWPGAVKGELVIVGSLDSIYIDKLVKDGKLDVSAIDGQWESFQISTVEKPFKGISRALVVAGADRRGAAFGLFEISRLIGVSPWYWWADVPAKQKDELIIKAGTSVYKSPSVKYRGIFINDEDWGLHPWAKKNFPEEGYIGPSTYKKVFELLLRLKANYIWPGMHLCTKAFNSFEENKFIADDYAIVVGSSHCEQMLRNNVWEWHRWSPPEGKKLGAWDWCENSDIIKTYWEQRVEEVGKFENVFTLGMRGIHDSGMPCSGSSNRDKARIMQDEVIPAQRDMIAKHVNADPAQVAQIFCPYKEVLGLYRLGMEVPDDVTLVWPDDNHGYVRTVSTPEERKRSGGAGIYYHMSYWGSPHDYLWISSTSPARISYEMSKAYAYDAKRLWVFNVGDIKPAEMEMDFALQLAWDIDSWPAENAMDFLEQWFGGIFGKEYAADIATIEKEYYRLAQQARPEHRERVSFSEKERSGRLSSFNAITEKAESIYASLAEEYKDAFYQLVLYPVKGAAMMDRKFTCLANGDLEGAQAAYDEIQKLSHYYNKQMAGGKWDGMMDPAPRRLSVFGKPGAGNVQKIAEPIMTLNPLQAQCRGTMELAGNKLIARGENQLAEGNGSVAVFTFDSAETHNATLYFLAVCPDDKQDSWFVSLNDRKVLSNDQPTGLHAEWLEIMDCELIDGENKLTITQRESGTQIEMIALMEQGKRPRDVFAEPKHIFAADACSSSKDTAVSKWKRIVGLGIESSAMTVLPYETRPIEADAIENAPSITYSFEESSTDCRIEARFLPTHHINNDIGLRYAVSVDGDEAQIVNLQADEWTGEWSENVLRGYSAGNTAHKLAGSTMHRVTIYLLDPGIVLSQLRVY